MFSKRLMAKEPPPPPQWFHLKNDNHLEKTWEDFRNLILFNDRFTKGMHIAER